MPLADAKLKGRTQSLTPSVYNTLLALYLQEGSRVKHMRQSFVVTGAGLSGGYRTAYVSSNFLAQTGYERDEVIDQEFTTFAVVRPPALRPHLHVVFLPCRPCSTRTVNGMQMESLHKPVNDAKMDTDRGVFCAGGRRGRDGSDGICGRYARGAAGAPRAQPAGQGRNRASHLQPFRVQGLSRRLT